MRTDVAVLGAVVALAVVAAGCQPDAREMQQCAMEMQRQQMEMISQINKSVVGFGCVSIQCRPAGAALTIDGAEILCDADSLTIPLGVHEFTARWSEGATASRRIFVPQMDVKYDLKTDVTVGRSSGGIKHSGTPNVKKTVIVLEKPS